MRYRLGNTEVRSENAAKPVNLAGKDVLQWIKMLPKSALVLDYGCGKLRYTIPLSKRVHSVHSVDSKIQIERVQTIDGVKTTLDSYVAARLPNVTVSSVESEKWMNQQFDFILCANVLSAIPDANVRKTVLKRLYKVLRPGGSALIVTHFKSTYFKFYESNPKSERFLDGWLVRGTKCATFYGVIPPEKLESMCIDAGFTIIESRVNDKRENALVVVGKAPE